MKIRKSIYDEILITCPVVPPEIGGILGENNDVVSEVCFDSREQSRERAEYCPSVEYLNTVIFNWSRNNIRFSGMFHSHFPNQPALSKTDICYIKKIFRALPGSIQKLYFPIVLPRIEIVSFIAYRINDGVSICEDKVIIVEKEN